MKKTLIYLFATIGLAIFAFNGCKRENELKQETESFAANYPSTPPTINSSIELSQQLHKLAVGVVRLANDINTNIFDAYFRPQVRNTIATSPSFEATFAELYGIFSSDVIGFFQPAPHHNDFYEALKYQIDQSESIILTSYLWNQDFFANFKWGTRDFYT